MGMTGPHVVVTATDAAALGSAAVLAAAVSPCGQGLGLQKQVKQHHTPAACALQR